MPQRKNSAYVNGAHDCKAIASIIFTLNDTQENIAIIAVYALWVFLIINVGNVKVDYLWCIDLPAWQLTSHNKSNVGWAQITSDRPVQV